MILSLGVGVVNPFTRNPALTAMSAATLDRISGGRFLLGLGRSDSWVVQYRMGIPYRDPRASLKETVETVRALLSGSPVTSEGGQFNLANVGLATLPVQDRLPIYLAAIGPRALRLAGAVADGVLLNAYTPTTYISYAVDEVRRAARETGRDPCRRGHRLYVSGAPDRRPRGHVGKPQVAGSAAAGRTPRR